MRKPLSGVVFGLVLLLAATPAFHAARAGERLWRLGFLDLNPPPSAANAPGNLEPFLAGMRALGYVQNRDFIVEARYADADFSRVPRLAQELVDAGVDIIVTVGTPTTVAAKRATATLPIVMTGGERPVERGLIASFARPGGNVTGLTHKPGPEFAPKAVQLLAEIVPRATRFCIAGAISNAVRGLPFHQEWVGVTVKPGATLLFQNFGQINTDKDLDANLGRMVEDGCEALFLYPEFVFIKYLDSIREFIKARRLPVMVQQKNLIDDGALLYYYTDFLELRRRAATYVDKIIRGARPGELPVEQPSKFEFIVNLNTARELGLTIPQSIIAFADQVIE